MRTIDITMRPEVQNILGEKGGLPVLGDPSTIKDERTRTLTENFNTLLEQDGLAFYPDWPVPGYYDVLVSSLQGDRIMDAPTTNAGSLISLIPAVVFFLVFQRTLTRGVMAGAVK